MADYTMAENKKKHISNIFISHPLYIYTTSEKPVNDQSYGITILYK